MIMTVLINMLTSVYPQRLFINSEYKIIRYSIDDLILSSKLITKGNIVFHIQKYLVNN